MNDPKFTYVGAPSSNTDPFSRAREAGSAEAFGYLARDNAKTVLDLIGALLFVDGEARRYTKIRVRDWADWRPEVTTGVMAESVKLLDHDGHCAIRVIDTDDVWSLSSQLNTEPECGTQGALPEAAYVFAANRYLQANLWTPEGEIWVHLQVEGPR